MSIFVCGSVRVDRLAPVLAASAAMLALSACGNSGPKGQVNAPGATGGAAQEAPGTCDAEIADSLSAPELNGRLIEIVFGAELPRQWSLAGQNTGLGYALYADGQLRPGPRKGDRFYRESGQPFCAVGFNGVEARVAGTAETDENRFSAIPAGTRKRFRVSKTTGSNADFPPNSTVRERTYFRKTAIVSGEAKPIVELVCYYPAGPGREQERRDPDESKALNLVAQLRAALPSGAIASAKLCVEPTPSPTPSPTGSASPTPAASN
jgi:hypothetical protein